MDNVMACFISWRFRGQDGHNELVHMQGKPYLGWREEFANGNNKRLPVVIERMYGRNCTLLPLHQAVLHLAQQASTPGLQGQLLQHGLKRPGAVRCSRSEPSCLSAFL